MKTATRMKTATKQKRTKSRSAMRHKPAPKPKPAAANVTNPTSSDNNQTAHVLIRVRAEDGLTVEGHQKVIARHGIALFGKFGDPLGPAFRDLLNRQAANGQKTYLFITTRPDWRHEYVTFRCPLRQVLDTLDESKRHLVPGYYIAQAPYIRTWFEIEGIERLSREDMNRIFVLSSGRSITSAIFSRTGLFHVGIRNTSRAA